MITLTKSTTSTTSGEWVPFENWGHNIVLLTFNLTTTVLCKRSSVICRQVQRHISAGQDVQIVISRTRLIGKHIVYFTLLPRYDFKSWREYSYLDEEERDKADCKEERRSAITQISWYLNLSFVVHVLIISSIWDFWNDCMRLNLMFVSLSGTLIRLTRLRDWGERKRRWPEFRGQYFQFSSDQANLVFSKFGVDLFCFSWLITHFFTS